MVCILCKISHRHHPSRHHHLIVVPFMTLVFFRMVIPVVMVTIGTIMFVPISAMEINPVIKRIVVIASRSDTNFNQDTIPFPIAFIIMADVTHVFAGSPCYFKGQTDITPVASTLSVIVIQKTAACVILHAQSFPVVGQFYRGIFVCSADEQG